MAVMDEFKQERQSLKGQPLKKKLSYFWYYYKWYVIGGAAALIIISTLISDVLNNKDYAMYGIAVNAYAMEQDVSPFLDGYIEYAGIDTEEYNVLLDASFRMGQAMDENAISTSQMIMVYTAARDLDILAMDTANFNKYSYNSTFLDLREVLTPDQLEKYRDYLFYIDYAVVEKIDEAQENADLDFTIAYPDHTKPEDMENPVPVGLNLKGSEKFNQYYTFGDEEGYIGIVNSTVRVDNALAMIYYLFGE